METEWLFAPETAAEVRERYNSLEPTAETTVKQVARAMEFGSEGCDERVTEAVVETAQEVPSAALLAAQVGDRGGFKRWPAEHEDWTVVEFGGEHTDRAVWHATPVTETVVVTGFYGQRQAAAGTLRRQAFGRIHSGVVRCAG
ncbi:MAG: hypothetical protein ACI9CA_000358 [Natronomonas sp.]|jgi:hypothetical protein